ncbi:MAG: transcriptional regulator [Chloroflexota bacterium]
MDIQPVRTEEDYERALEQIDHLMDCATPSSPEEDTLDILATLVQAYEAKHHPIDPPDPISALEHYLDRQALTYSSLTPYIGTIGQVEAIMNRWQWLTLPMIHQLSPVTGIPIATLAQPYDLASFQATTAATHQPVSDLQTVFA